jgi:predicted nucleic acid-binding protein
MDALTVVVTDANVLINLMHVESLRILARLDGMRFVVVDEVIAEITDSDQARAIALAVQSGWISKESLQEPTGLELFATLVQTLGRGEAASLALASTCGYAIACDEKRVFRREAVARLGDRRILTTPGIMVMAIRAGVLSVAEADRMKETLARRRFVMSFASFKDVV